MAEDTTPIGSPVTLAELRALGEFVRWQDIGKRVADLAAAKRLPNGYPFVASRLPSNGMLDLCFGGRWRRVQFVRREGSAMGGDERIVYLDAGTEKSARYGWHDVAPAGHFTEWDGPRPEQLGRAELLDTYALPQQDHVIHSQSVVEEDWPYLTFEVESFNRMARWVDRDDMWRGRYTLHVADPRVKVEGIEPREPWFNTTIAVSHRWLRSDHPDPDRLHYRELMALCERLRLHDTQALLLDYCSLPQHPRSPDEEASFRKHLPGFQARFKHVVLVLNTGSRDYATRAWCMLELMLAAMSPTPRPTLLNHDALDEPLRTAKELAEGYMRHAGLNQQGMADAFRRGLTNATYREWARNPINVAAYNESLDGRRKILELFERELAVTDPNDRPLIVDLVKRLAFGLDSGVPA